jgi:hypothetical protein
MDRVLDADFPKGGCKSTSFEVGHDCLIGGVESVRDFDFALEQAVFFWPGLCGERGKFGQGFAGFGNDDFATSRHLVDEAGQVRLGLVDADDFGHGGLGAWWTKFI